ncbi:MAG: glycoside hydrolase family 97 protein [Saprospiraceae bacterium]
MLRLRLFLLFALAIQLSFAQNYQLASPDGKLQASLQLGNVARFSLKYRGNTIVEPSRIALITNKGTYPAFPTKAAKVSKNTIQRSVTPVVRQKSATIQEHCNELHLNFGSHTLVLRAYNEGFAYRFESAESGELYILDEILDLRLPPGDSIYFAEEESFMSHNERLYIKYAPADLSSKQFASLPDLIETQYGLKIFISESDLHDYAGMWLQGTGGNGFRAIFPKYPLAEKAVNDRDVLVTERADYIAKTNGTRTFPWRILAIAEQDADLIENQLVYLLARPSQGDFSWVKPGKVAWDWWNANNITGVDFKSGVNTDTYKYYVDFAAKNGLEYIILDEGWTTPGNLSEINPDMDMEALFAYTKSKNVRIIPWVLWTALDQQLIPMLDQFQKWDAAGIKVDFMQRDDQKMVHYYWRVAEEAAKRQLMVDFHGAYKPTGLHRTFPNVISNEGVRGLENSKWDANGDIGPEHNVTIPFIRMVAGPMDYTPGAMINAQKKDWRPIFDVPMGLGTRCHQIAMFVVYESPLQMLADSPSNYLKEPESLQFITPIPAVWDTTVALEGKVGDYIAVARRAANGDWYVGAMTDWTARSLTLDFSFLPNGTYQLEIFQDGINADRNAMDYKKVNRSVRSGEKLTIQMAPGGGWAARIRKE